MSQAYDPSSYIEDSVKHLAEILVGKNDDYTAGQGEFFNFEKAAEIAGITTLHAITSQIGIKVTRIQSLMKGGGEANEPLVDSYLDLAGYAIIAHAYLKSIEGVNYNV